MKKEARRRREDDRPLFGTITPSPLGDIRILATDDAVRGIFFVGQKHDFGRENENIRWEKNAILASAISCLKSYFRGESDIELPPLDPQGTAFEKAVWSLLSSIPYGKTTTYGRIAKAMEERGGRRTSPRAVGNAIARNPISILIPCHRVLGAKVQWTGYAGGIERKKWLLEHEGRVVARIERKEENGQERNQYPSRRPSSD